MARFAAIGLDHRHVYDMTEGLLKAGADCAGYDSGTTDPRVLAGFRKRFPHVPEVPRDRLLDDPSIDFIVLSAVPCDRAGLAIEAMRRGKDVMSDKPGVTTSEQLEAVRRTVQCDRTHLVDLCWACRLASDPGGLARGAVRRTRATGASGQSGTASPEPGAAAGMVF